MEEDTDLATFAGLTAAVARADPGITQRGTTIGAYDGTFCAHCGDTRRMQLICLFWDDRWAAGAPRPNVRSHETWTPPANEDPLPALFLATCLQCRSPLTLVGA